MENWLEIVAINSVLITLLALVAVASRLLRMPHVTHAFWFLVLVKILMVPVLELPILPSLAQGSMESPAQPIAAPTAVTAPVTSERVTAELADPRSIRGPREVFAPQPAAGRSAADALWLWGFGALAVWVLARVRIFRFSRLVRQAEPAARWLSLRVQELAAKIGLEQCPEVLVLDRRVPPLVWAPFSSPRIILPRALLERLEPEELDTVLTHELAHVRRGDHQVRIMEFLACSLFWWHPVVWWAKRSLRRVEEICCDDCVLRTLPDSARAYADGLLKTLEFTSARRSPLPDLASGIVAPRHKAAGAESLKDIEQRLTMIMKHQPPRPRLLISRLLIPYFLCVLVIFPTWAERSPDDPEASPEAEISPEVQRQLDLEREALELERQRREMEAQQLDARYAAHQAEIRARMEEAQAQAEASEAAGHAEEAEEIRRELVRAEKEAHLDAQRYELERDRMAQHNELQQVLQQHQLEAAELGASGRHAEAREAREKSEDLAMELARRAMELQQQEMALQQRYLLKEALSAETEAMHLEAAGELESAERLEQVARQLRSKSERAKTEAAILQQRKALELEEARMAADLRRLESEARDKVEAEAMKLQQRRKELAQKLVIQELRQMLEEIDDNGELVSKLDQLEDALASKLPEDGWY